MLGLKLIHVSQIGSSLAADMASITQETWVLVFHEEGLQRNASPRCGEIVEHALLNLWFFKSNIQFVKGQRN